MNIPQGRLICGRYAGVEPVIRQDGSTVADMYRLVVSVDSRSDDDDPIILSPSFFRKVGGPNGEISRVGRQLDELRLQAGELVLLRIEQVRKGNFTNENVKSVARVDGQAGAGKPPLRSAAG